MSIALGIIDYGAGNMESVRQMFRLLDQDVVKLSEPEQVLDCDRIILPGVGAAGTALAQLRARHLVPALHEVVRVRGRPMLGICLGMQLLAEKLYEFGEHEGLGWVKGDVVSLHEVVPSNQRVPHVGWNQVDFGDDSNGASPVRPGGEYYFAHSYTLRATNPADVIAMTVYGNPIVAAIQVGTIFATQFHPEKSQTKGESLLTTFLDWSP